MTHPNVQEAAEAAIAASATKVMYAGSAGGILGAISAHDAVAWVGAAVAIGGFFVNLYYRYRQDKREEREHQRRMSESGGD